MSEKIDVEEEQRLAASYVAQTDGPFIDIQRPIADLIEGYKTGHETFLQKLESLAVKFPRWRRLKGDGSCGFRALLFGLFESIIQTGNPELLQLAKKTFQDRWTALGIDELYEMWLEEITDLSSRLESKLSSGGDALAELENEFNDDNNQRNFIQFLRTLTASYIRANKELYQASMDEDLEKWCQEHVEIPDAELDYVSLAAAYAVLLSGLGITVNIHHVDLSPGAEANVHVLSPDVDALAAKSGLPPIWMLYRPGHYDLVYSS